MTVTKIYCKKMDYLLRVNAAVLAILIFVVVNVLYYYGPLSLLSYYLPLLWNIPALIVISGLIREQVEGYLGSSKVDPEGKAILITGCDTGFGHALAKKLAKKG
jgi:hypothetical protein